MADLFRIAELFSTLLKYSRQPSFGIICALTEIHVEVREVLDFRMSTFFELAV